MLGVVQLATIPHHLAAMRPGFLAVTAVACGLGVAAALACGGGARPLAAVATVVLALLAHAAANVYNDWADDRLGSDAINEDRIAPFSGGSRQIQDGVLAAVVRLARHARQPRRLRPAVVLTLAAALSHGLLLGAAFVAVPPLR